MKVLIDLLGGINYFYFMKHCLSILVLFFCFESYGQLYTEKKAANSYDSLGIKQGFWIERTLKVKLHYYFYTVTNSAQELTQATQFRYFRISEGEYNDGKRVGTWLDYSDCMNYFDLTESEQHIDDKNIEIDTSKASKLDGQIFLTLDTINVNCIQGNCVFTTSNNQEFKRFTREKLDTELLNLATCKYDRIICKKKKHR
ncbi:MAG: hypothetical protein ABI723_01270 [Bacteroidia bacterium]